MDKDKMNDTTPNFDTDSSAKEVVSLYLDDIIPNRFQPRERFDESALKELAASIKEHGVIQPIIVRKIGDKYEIIAGERRYKASALAGLTKIPAIIRNLDDKESSKVALLENLQRKNLSAIEEARTYQKILDLDEMTQYELAKTMGKSQPAVANKLRLLSLPDEVQDALLKEKISERHARSLLNLTAENEQIEMLHKIINNRMTVREVDEEIKSKNTINPLQDLKSNNQELPIVENNTDKKEIEIPQQKVENSVVTIDKLLNINSDNNFDAVTTPDLDELRNRSKDINNIEEPLVDLDKLIKPAIEEKTEDFKFVPNLEEIEKEIKEENDVDKLESIVPTFETPKEEIDVQDNVKTTEEVKTIEETISEEAADPKEEILEIIDNNDDNQDSISLESMEQMEIKDTIVTKDDAIKKIQETVDEIKKKNIDIDSEGMDFGDTYQIIIRIKKSE